MLPRKLRSPFSLYKKTTPTGIVVWYARFWDAVSEKYAVTRSTGVEALGKRERRAEADRVARELLPSIKFTPKTKAKKFLDYVEAFWQPDSAYAKEKALVHKKPLSKAYIKNSRETFLFHVKPYEPFKNLTLQELTAGMIRDWRAERIAADVSPRRINAAMQAMRVAVRYAVERDELEKDPFANVTQAVAENRERGILTPVEVRKLLDWRPEDPRVRLALLLEVCCGLRRGEVRGLLWSDLSPEEDQIRVQHNWVDSEGLKAPKNRSGRTVPYPQAVKDAVEAVKAVSPFVGPKDFVVFGVGDRTVPATNEFMRISFTMALTAIGIAPLQRTARNLKPHGLRHTFVTLGRMSGLSDIEIQAIAGHKSPTMMEHYSHAGQVIDFREAKRKLEQNVLGAVSASI
jgi:integrase